LRWRSWRTPARDFRKLPAGLRVVKVNDWRDKLYSRGVLDREAKSPREDFRRVSLQARKLIGEGDGVVWRACTL
jgi:hypothetical protein